MMKLIKESVILLLSFVSSVHQTVVQAETQESRPTSRSLTLQQCFQSAGQLQLKCQDIADIATNSLRVNQTQTFSYELSGSEKQAIQEAAKNNDIYFLRAHFGSDPSDIYMQSFCKASDLVNSLFVMGVTLNVDTFGKVFALEVVAPIDQLDSRLAEMYEEPSEFTNTLTGLVLVQGSQVGPSPDLEGFKRKVAKERAEKLAAETGDNRSFLAKYWMYIVPVVLFMLFSGQFGGQGGGGGGAA